MPNTPLSRSFNVAAAQVTQAMSFCSILLLIGQFFLNGIAKELIGAIVILQVVNHLVMINTEIPGQVTLTFSYIKPISTFNMWKELGRINDFIYVFDYKAQKVLKRLYMIQPLISMGTKSFNFIHNTGNLGQVV